jgi:Tol biopolymer transport system component
MAQQFDVGNLKLTGEPRPIPESVPRLLAYEGRLNFSVSQNGVLLYEPFETPVRYAWIDRTGKRLGTVGEPMSSGYVRLSPDGQHIATARPTPSSGSTFQQFLWHAEASRGVENRLTFTGSSNAPVFSPDGRTIVFTLNGNLFRTDIGGAGTQQPVLQGRNTRFATDWSRDGRYLLYYELDPDTSADLWFLPVTPDATGAVKPRQYLKTPFNESYGRFSPEPNPRWIAYQSNESGRFEVYIQAFPEPKGKWQISRSGGRYPTWGAGGKELFYLSLDDKLISVGINLGENSVEPSPPRELFPLPSVDTSYIPYDTADGGKFLVRAVPEPSAQPLTVIINWPTLLKK